MKFFLTIKNYLHEALVELRKVVWPTQTQTKIYSIIVIAMSIFLTVYVGVLDYIFNALLGFIV